jgi:hypothetical protein
MKGYRRVERLGIGDMRSLRRELSVPEPVSQQEGITCRNIHLHQI